MTTTPKKSTNDKFNSEQVLVAPDDIFKTILGDGEDFFRSSAETLIEIKRKASFIAREKAENDESFRQIIPYVVIYRTHPKTEFFLFKRLNTQGEERLHNLYSLGAGGHINPIDKKKHDPLSAGLMRELEEELFLPDSYELSFKGWIYSRIDPVACVHAGMIYLMNVPDGEIRIRETDKMTGEWCDIPALISRKDSMEGWSRIVLEHLIG